MKKINFITGLLLTLVSLATAQAKTEITGDVYGQVFQNMTMSDGGAGYNVTIEDLNAGENCDNEKQTCLLEGFSWAQKVGWTYWDGLGLQTELGGILNFPDEYMPKANYLGSLEGFAWGENFGWIQLSVCSGIDAQVDCDAKGYCGWTANNYCEADKENLPPEVSVQTDTDWGVYVDFCKLKTDQPTCESVQSNSYCNWDAEENICVLDSDNNPNGQPLRGYAWSEYLGWVKFNPEPGDTGFSGALTNWSADITPPDIIDLEDDPEDPNDPYDPGNLILEPNTAWIPNESPDGIINWLEFAKEAESQIDLANSTITVNSIDNGFGGDFDSCPDPMPNQSNGNVIINQEATGEVNLAIPKIGLVGTPPYGFCKYTLGGVIYNQAGLGFYLGSEGLAAANADGVDPLNPEPNAYREENITLYVRAGDFDANESSIVVAGNGTAVADGSDMVNATFAPKDIAGNPILPVETSLIVTTLPEPDPANWVRDIKLLYDFNQSQYYFDRLNLSRNVSYPMPVEVEGLTYMVGDTFKYPLSGNPESLPNFFGNYSLDVIGFAPTTFAGNILELNNITLDVLDLPIPAASPSLGPWNTGGQLSVKDSLTSSPLPLFYDLKPALEVIDGQLDIDFITLGQSIQASYEVINNSSSVNLNDYGIDHIMSFTDSGGIGVEALEIRDVILSGSSEKAFGRTDPIAGETRYHILRGPGNQQENEFHNDSQNYHLPIYKFNDGLSTLNGNGVYTVDGSYYVSPGAECLSDSSCPPISIDRTVVGLAQLSGGETTNYTFNLTPSQYVGDPIDTQVSFDLVQYLSYDFPGDFSQSAIYQAQPYIADIDVKVIGLGTSGIVGGQQVFNPIAGRDLATITTSSADLRKEIRRNVATLTRNLEPCLPGTLSSLSTTGSACIAVDEINKNIVAFYSGTGAVRLNNGGDNLLVPSDYKYTIIVAGGANLSIESNVVYGGTNNSLGMIVLEDEAEGGGNVYLHPSPTNMVGLLYAEGSILSSPDAGSTLYYGQGAGNVVDLKNQLYWQGSLASKNTIGGAPNKVIPEGVDCQPWNDDIDSCSQAYDLDFVRRFTTINDQGVDFAPNGYYFSGGGSCSGTPPVPNCISGSLPSTVEVVGDGTINVSSSKSLDTVFVERDNRPVPPGFSSSGGLTSSQEIR